MHKLKRILNIKQLAFLSALASFYSSASLTTLPQIANQYFSNQHLSAQHPNNPYSQPKTQPNTQSLTVKWLFDTHTQQNLFELKQLVGFTIDQQRPLTSIIQYGITPHRPGIIKNSYLINLYLHPFWADATNLFQPLSTPKQLNQQWSSMQAFGFTDNQLKRLKQRLTQYSQQQSQQLNQWILKNHIVNQAQQQQWSETKTGKEFVRHSKQLHFSAANLWAQSTLSIFSPKTRQKLIDYLQQQLRFIVITRAPISLAEFANIGANLHQQHQQSIKCQANAQSRSLLIKTTKSEPNNDQI